MGGGNTLGLRRGQNGLCRLSSFGASGSTVACRLIHPHDNRLEVPQTVVHVCVAKRLGDFLEVQLVPAGGLEQLHRLGLAPLGRLGRGHAARLWCVDYVRRRRVGVQSKHRCGVVAPRPWWPSLDNAELASSCRAPSQATASKIRYGWCGAVCVPCPKLTPRPDLSCPHATPTSSLFLTQRGSGI
jgi:hypothetical protein